MRRSISPVNNVNTPSIITSAGTVIPARAVGDRRAWSIQNVGTNAIFVRMGGTASTSVFHFIIKGGTGDSDGLGGSIEESVGAVFQGLISIAGTTPKLVIKEYV